MSIACVSTPMFTILQYTPSVKDPSVPSAQHLSFARPALSLQLHAACDICRAKKVKCSGEKTGCSRCRSKDRSCTYMTAEDKASKKSSRRRRRANCPSASSAATSSAATSSAATSSTPFNPAVRDNFAKGQEREMEVFELENIDCPPAPHPVEGEDSDMDQLPEKSSENADDGTFTYLYKATTHNSQQIGQQANHKESCRPQAPDRPEECLNLFSSLQSPIPEFMTSGDFHALKLEVDIMDKLNAFGTAVNDSYFDEAVAEPSPSMMTPSTLNSSLQSPSYSTSQISSPTRFCPIQELQEKQNPSGFLFSPMDDESCSSTATPSIDFCQCMTRAMRILDDLEGSSHRLKGCAADYILSFLRRCLRRCMMILDCRLLIWSSESMTLLVVICRKFLDLFDRTMTECRQMEDQSWGFAQLGKTPGRIFHALGDYELDSLDEIRDLMSWIVVTQLKKLEVLLLRVRKIAAQYCWETQLVMLEPLNRQCQDMILSSSAPAEKSQLSTPTTDTIDYPPLRDLNR